MEDKSRTVSGSNGLGLYITKEIVDDLSGVIEVKSKKEKGSRFVVRIPIEEGKIRRTITEAFDALPHNVKTFFISFLRRDTLQFISFPEVLRNASQGDAYCGNIADTAVFAWLGSRLFQPCGVRQNHACRRLIYKTFLYFITNTYIRHVKSNNAAIFLSLPRFARNDIKCGCDV